MKLLSKYRKQQLAYICVDILSSLLVWLAFLGFRWMVYDGKVMGVDTLWIPMFDFYRPLLLYPLGCLMVYYLMGYYLRPFNKDYAQEFRVTFLSALLIAFAAFFVIIIDDPVSSYHRYLTSLLVLIGVHFVLSYLPRLCVTILSRNRGAHLPTCYTIRSLKQIDDFKQHFRKRMMLMKW